MNERLPTKRTRRALSQDYGYRPRNNWGSGDLPAPWCPGDIVRLVRPGDDEWRDRMRGVPVNPGGLYLVSCAFSIDEGDAWYFRVSTPTATSDRLHVAGEGRFNRQGFSAGTVSLDYMAPFGLVDTPDPDGLELRRRLLADGWSYTPPPLCVCPSCGHTHPGGNQ